MKFILAAIACLLFGAAKAQVILIKPNLSNCARCNLKLNNEFNAKRIGIPTYLVFSSSAVSDSAEIENALQYKENGIYIVFSDKILQRFKGASDVLYIDVDGNTVERNLYDVNQKDLDSFSWNYHNKYKFLSSQSKLYRYEEERLLIVDDQLKSARLIDGGDTFVHKMTEKLQSTIQSKFNTIYPGIFSTTVRYLQANPMQKFIVRPVMGSFSLSHGSVYCIAKISYLDSIDIESFDMKSLYALLRFNRNKVDVYPVNIPHLVSKKILAEGPRYLYST